MTHTPAELRKMCQQPLKINELTYLGTVASKHIPALLDEVERLREALQPFADAAIEADSWNEGFAGCPVSKESIIANTVSYADCQRARAALQPDLMGEKDGM